MKKTISLFFLGMTLCLTACRQQMPKAYITELDSNESLTIAIGNSEMTNYHSERLGIDITYPSYLRHQYLEEDQMEVFMTDDVSLSFMVKHIDENLRRSPGQDMMVSASSPSSSATILNTRRR